MAWYSGWSRAQRLVITVPTGTVSALPYFPVALTASSLPTELTNNTYGRSDGGDLAFAADLGVGNSVLSIGAQLPCEVVSAAFGGTPSAEIHTQVPSVAATGTLTYIWVLYGNSGQTTQPAATSTYGSQAVWKENGTQNFAGVWHLQGTGTPASWADSTSNGVTGTNHGATATTGAIGGGAAFASASSQYIDCGNNSLFNFTTSNFTLSSWVNPISFSGGPIILCRGLYNTDGWYLQLNAANTAFTSTTSPSTATGEVSTGAWHNLQYSRSGTGVPAAYYDGVVQSVSGNFANPVTSTRTLKFGAYDTPSNFLNGSLDEIRISSVARNASWLKAEYSNGSAPGTFIAPPGGQGPIALASTGGASAIPWLWI